jgi:hypothetical protein
MPGKNDGLARRFPAAEPRDAGYQAEVDAAKQDYQGDRSAEGLAGEYARLRGERDVLDEQLRALNVRVNAAEQMLWDALEASGLEAVRLKSGKNISMTRDVTVAVEDREAFNTWIREQHLESLFTVHAGKVLSMTKERLLAGEVLPAGVKVGSIKKTNYRS